jgi:Reverse transcriptase (RNA-dependent DNA polymerase)
LTKPINKTHTAYLHPLADFPPLLSPFPQTSDEHPIFDHIDHPQQPTVPTIHTMTTRSQDNTRKQREFPGFITFHTTSDTDPTSFTYTNKFQNWRDAMATELNALATNQTWTLVPPPPNQRVIGCKWVFKTKRNPDGSVERYKARLVAKGFHQEPGVDFEKTCSPVIRATTIRIILFIVVSSNWSIKQLDVSSVFLNGDLTETVYIDQPRGFIDQTHPNYVCLLHKFLYGLKHAPRAWFAKLSTTLVSLVFKPSCYDPSLFLSHKNNQTLLVLVYVDDLIIIGNDTNQIVECIAQISCQFSIRDLCNINYFLGVQAIANSDGVHLSQAKYTSDLLKKVNMLNAKPVSSPMASGTILTQEGSIPCSNPHLYRSIVGSLQYATLTRPEIAYSVNKLS